MTKSIPPEYHPEIILKEAFGLSANIYRCAGQNGPYYTVNFNYNYRKKSGESKASREFTVDQLLALSHLVKRSYNYICCQDTKNREHIKSTFIN